MLSLDRGVYFNGTSSHIVSANKLNYIGSIDAFLRHTDVTKTRSILISSDESVEFVYMFITTSGNLEAMIKTTNITNGNTNLITIISSGDPSNTLTTDLWVHVALGWTYNGFDTTIQLFKNGISIKAEASVDSIVEDNSSSGGYIGKKSNAEDTLFLGFMYEFAISNYLPDFTEMSTDSCS